MRSLEEINELPFEQSFALFQELNRTKDEMYKRNIVIRVLEIWGNVAEETKNMWLDVLDSLGFYPYLFANKDQLDLTSQIRYYYHESEHLPDIVFHKEQKKVIEILNDSKNVILSAPTSYGKSLIIRELVAMQKFNNILIIQPSLALINETRISLSNFSSNYNFVLNSRQVLKEKNIFILTAERALELSNTITVDLLVLDEFYKISGKANDERTDTLNIAISKIIYKNKPLLYFIGPNIDEVSDEFKINQNADFIRSEFSMVRTNLCQIAIPKEIRGQREKRKYKESNIFELLFEHRMEQSIVYCSSPENARKAASNYYKFLHNTKGGYFNSIAIDTSIMKWIKSNIDENWELKELLKKKIGFHSGILPRYLSHALIKDFNDMNINVLFVTSTIIEGVNTNAKNMFILDNKKGSKLIDYFDFSNIQGRAGRMMKQFSGNVFFFEDIPPKDGICVDVPFTDQNDISDEILINLPSTNVKTINQTRYEALNNYDYEILEVIKSTGASIEGQKNIVIELQKEIQISPKKINWSDTPTYDQLLWLIKLCWNNLGGNTGHGIFSEKQLTFTARNSINNDMKAQIALEYKFQYEKLKSQISPEKNIEYIARETAINNVFQRNRQWFSFRLPKWLSIVNKLQKIICDRAGILAGDYSKFIALLESEGVSDPYSILLDYGIPASTIKKMIPIIGYNTDDLLEFIRNNSHAFNTFDDFEKRVISEI